MLNKTITFITVMLVVFTTSAEASMQDTLSQIFNYSSNTTQGSAFTSATRSGYVGGGVTLRIPIKPINLMTFDPPRLSAGCGGIDMYAGSFTFINAAQFTALLRLVMQQASGLLFQSALQIICPSCSTMLTEFQKIIQDMNALASNTCALANQTVSSLKGDGLTTEMQEAKARVGADMGTFSDHFSGLHPSSQAQAKSDTQATEAFNPHQGNLTWKAMNRSQAADAIATVSMITADPSDPTGKIPKLFLMSLLGTQINTGYQQEANTANTNLDNKATIYGPLFGLASLMNAQNLFMYNCSSSGAAVKPDSTYDGPYSCVTIDSTTPLDFAGTRYYVRNMLFGDSTVTSASAMQTAVNNQSPANPGPHSIYYKLQNCVGQACGLSPAEQTFLLSAGPLIKIMKDIQATPDSILAISQYIEENLAYSITIQLGEAVLRAARSAWSGVAGVDEPLSVEKNIQTLAFDLQNLRIAASAHYQDMDRAVTVAENVRKAFTQSRMH